MMTVCVWSSSMSFSVWRARSLTFLPSVMQRCMENSYSGSCVSSAFPIFAITLCVVRPTAVENFANTSILRACGTCCTGSFFENGLSRFSAVSR
jgi:hypothetical protein